MCRNYYATSLCSSLCGSVSFSTSTFVETRTQIGAKIPMSRKFVDPDIGVMEAIFTLLQNAFIKALEPVLENSVTINSVQRLQEQKGAIDRVFKRRKEK